MKLWTNWCLALAGSFSMMSLIGIAYDAALYGIAATTLTAVVCFVLGMLIEVNEYE